MGKRLKVLILEDIEPDAGLLIQELLANGFDPEYERVYTEKDFRFQLENRPWDIVLVDSLTPTFDAPTALEIFKTHDLDIPFIIISGAIGEETAVEMMKAGAHDYVMKGRLQRLVPAIKRELQESKIRRNHRLFKENVDRKTATIKAVNQVFQEALLCESSEDLARTCLNAAIEITESRLGYIGFVNEKGKLDILAMTGLETCSENSQVHALDVSGMWGLPEEDDRPFFLNENDPGSEHFSFLNGCPEINNILSLPLIRAGKRTGIITIANRKSQYSANDVEVMESLGIALVEAIFRKTTEMALRLSEKKFRTLFDASADAIFIHDLEGKFLEVNEVAFRRMGFSREEFLKLPPESLNDPQYAHLMPQKISSLLKKGHHIFETAHITKNGEVIPIELSSRVIEFNNQTAILSVGRDISERMEAEKALWESEVRFRELFHNLKSGVVVFDPIDDGSDFVFKDLNAVSEKLNRIKREEVIGRRLTEVFPGVKDTGLFECIQNVWITGRPMTHPATHFADERIRGWREHYIYMLPLGEVVTVFDDVTDKQQAERELLGSHRFLEIANKETKLPSLVDNFAKELKEIVGCQMVGILILNQDGDSLYQRFIGFDEKQNEKIESEKIFTDRNLCRELITNQGKTILPFCTKWGSLRINDVDSLTRNGEEINTKSMPCECIDLGFKSIALVPINAPEKISGIIYLADRGKEKLPLEIVKFVEERAIQLGTALRRVQAEEELHHRLEIEQLLFSVSRRFVNYQKEKLPEEIDGALKQICEFIQVEKGTCVFFDQESKSKADCFEWSMLSDGKALESRTIFTPELPERLAEYFKSDDAVQIFNIDQLPPDLELYKKSLVGERTRAVLIVPLFYSRKLLGVLGFESASKEMKWCREDISFLKTVGDIILHVLEHNRAERQKIRLAGQLRQQQKLDSIGTLASGVAHEINNPLNGIMNFAELIIDRADPESRVSNYAERILKESKRVNAIISNLLAFARQEKEQHSLANIRDIVNSALMLIGAVLRKDQITVEMEVPENLPSIKCRSRQIQQVLMNLITNARDGLNQRYTQYHENKIIRLTAIQFEKEGRPWIRMTVEDHGAGIKPEIIDRVFDPFFTTKPENVGTGLGLSVSHGIIKEHLGELWIESEPEKYVRFQIDIPVDNGWDLTE